MYFVYFIVLFSKKTKCRENATHNAPLFLVIRHVCGHQFVHNNTLFIFSDLLILLEGSKQLHGHRFVLAARSDYWGVPDLAKVSTLDLSGTVT